MRAAEPSLARGSERAPAGTVQFGADTAAPRIAIVTLSHLRRRNAMSRVMWAELRAVFESIQAEPHWRAVVVRGAGGHFCAGGDIAEYPDIRFDVATLANFHEREVWGALAAMLACDVPMVAAIEGSCMGAGVEIAACCDIRVAAADARFGAPIARLGFPMAPREADLLRRTAGEATLREMLLEAAQLGAATLYARGFVHEVAKPADAAARAHARADAMTRLAPAAARANKRTLRALNRPPAPAGIATAAIEEIVNGAYDYAASAEHREGIAAFIGKRPPAF